MKNTSALSPVGIAIQLGSQFDKNSQPSDKEHSFVYQNYKLLALERIFSAMVPAGLGGAGWSHADMCYFLREIAKSCSSTALALSMHQHLVAANVWKYKKGQGSEELLKRVAAGQLVLVSTGAGDWLSSHGEMRKTEGGYKVTARKHFASQAPVGDLLVTSAPFNDVAAGSQVLHFAIPFTSEGVTVENNWYAMGMRGTGSATVVLKDVFVPEGSVSLRRPQGEFHPFWNVVLTVAMPLIMSAYVGIAEKAAEIALQHAKAKKEPFVPILLGELFGHLTNARVLWQDMIRICNDLDFQPLNEHGNEILVRKTMVANACIQVVQKAFEIVGGQAYLERTGLEKLYRDIVAASYHPLAEKEQQLFTGNFLLGNRLVSNG